MGPYVAKIPQSLTPRKSPCVGWENVAKIKIKTHMRVESLGNMIWVPGSDYFQGKCYSYIFFNMSKYIPCYHPHSTTPPTHTPFSHAYFLILMKVRLFFSVTCNKLAMIIKAWLSAPCLICFGSISLCCIQIWQPFLVPSLSAGASQIHMFILEACLQHSSHPFLSNSCIKDLQVLSWSSLTQ